MRYNIKVAVERYSNGKEPHWKCGVPQGIVRSSRILSAKVPDAVCIGIFSFEQILIGEQKAISRAQRGSPKRRGSGERLVGPAAGEGA